MGTIEEGRSVTRISFSRWEKMKISTETVVPRMGWIWRKESWMGGCWGGAPRRCRGWGEETGQRDVPGFWLYPRRKADPHPSLLCILGKEIQAEEERWSSRHDPYIGGPLGLQSSSPCGWAGARLLGQHVFRFGWKQKASHETKWWHWIGWALNISIFKIFVGVRLI